MQLYKLLHLDSAIYTVFPRQVLNLICDTTVVTDSPFFSIKIWAVLMMCVFFLFLLLDKDREITFWIIIRCWPDGLHLPDSSVCRVDEWTSLENGIPSCLQKKMQMQPKTKRYFVHIMFFKPPATWISVTVRTNLVHS